MRRALLTLASLLTVVVASALIGRAVSPAAAPVAATHGAPALPRPSADQAPMLFPLAAPRHIIWLNVDGRLRATPA